MSPRIPKYRKHRTGQARVTVAGRTYYLGKFDSPESHERYRRLLDEWLMKTGRFSAAPAESHTVQRPNGITVNEVALAYIKHAEEYYQTNPTEVEKVKLSVRPLRMLQGRTLAASFDSLALEAVRDTMIESGLARTTINERIRVLKRLFKWGIRKKLVPATVVGELMSVEGLKRGRTKARETDPVRPVPEEHIEAVLPLVSRHVKGMICLQLLTGARPGEVCIMRRADLDTSGSVWVYRPRRHKNQYRGQSREIYLGPKAQAIAQEFFLPSLDTYLFSPMLAREERYRELRLKRKSKVPPSQLCRRKAKPSKLPGKRYTTYSYRRAIQVACEIATVPAWSPHQLRHNAATKMRKDHGVELARIILGHKSAFTTEIYAEVDRRQAIEVMAMIG